ncbi:hypothetical protein H0H87_000463 [Tephrocybe sp. NHM501043]|nr:hypothetical protein H0H87_000463 [Tephrocybe sp. NHM501043]
MGTPSLAVSSSVLSGVPPIWMTETASSLVALNTPYSLMAESPFLSAVAPTRDNYPQLPIPSSQSTLEPRLESLQSPTIFTLTVTETLTVTASASSPLATPPDSTREWQVRNKMEDLSDFKISKYSGGKENLEVIQGIPADMAVSSTSASNNDTSTSPATKLGALDDSGSVIQLFYPAGSINPAQRPIGGAQFYATPLDLTGARNVTFEYSVFFPSDFNWVLGGKMPGLYGGHAGCSGGNDALDCWSTRLMWRKEGKGELYLYAPKDKQTEKLCGNRQSVCDAAYGLSVGRGSFTWGAGAWTTVRQTVTLNTPGQQDGCFTLDVNGQRVIDRSDIFYRDSPPKNGHAPKPPHKGEGGIGGLLGTLLSNLLPRAPETQGPNPNPTPTVGIAQQVDQGQQAWAISTTATDGNPDPKSTTTQNPQPTASLSVLANGDSDNADEILVESQGEPVGFTGLFFSSFFGGHEPRYATPTDQYSYFRRFSMIINA